MEIEPEGSEDASHGERSAARLPDDAARRVRDALGADAAEVIRLLSQQSSQSPQQVVETLTYMFRGPHPPPAMLEAYERIVPGAADRILEQGLSETAHRHAMEQGLLDVQREDMRASHRETRLGLYLGFAVVGLVLIAGVVAIILGQPLVGGVTLVADLAALAAVFVYGSSVRLRDLERD